MTWIKGRHAFKGGIEVRFVSDPGYDAFGARPIANIGTGSVPQQNITTITGIGQNAGGAGNLLNDLSGSLGGGIQTFNSPGRANTQFLAGQTPYRTLPPRQYSLFFKSEFSGRP